MLICFLSCGDTKVMRNVAAADSLTEVNQQEAVRYIDSVARADKGMSRNGRMKLLLLRTNALNKMDCPLDMDTLASLVKYFDRHGTANDKMLANYILGYYYIGKGNPPEAMRYHTLQLRPPTRPMPAATGEHCIRFTCIRLSS